MLSVVGLAIIGVSFAALTVIGTITLILFGLSVEASDS